MPATIEIEDFVRNMKSLGEDERWRERDYMNGPLNYLFGLLQLSGPVINTNMFLMCILF